jgi:hypothetical protein
MFELVNGLVNTFLSVEVFILDILITWFFDALGSLNQESTALGSL